MVSVVIENLKTWIDGTFHLSPRVPQSAIPAARTVLTAAYLPFDALGQPDHIHDSQAGPPDTPLLHSLLWSNQNCRRIFLRLRAHASTPSPRAVWAAIFPLVEHSGLRTTMNTARRMTSMPGGDSP